MPLYVRKKDGSYTPLSRDAIKAITRRDKISDLRDSSRQLMYAARALTAWLHELDRKSRHIGKEDLVVPRLPNRLRLQRMCDRVEITDKAFSK